MQPSNIVVEQLFPTALGSKLRRWSLVARSVASLRLKPSADHAIR